MCGAARGARSVRGSIPAFGTFPTTPLPTTPLPTRCCLGHQQGKHQFPPKTPGKPRSVRSAGAQAVRAAVRKTAARGEGGRPGMCGRSSLYQPSSPSTDACSAGTASPRRHPAPSLEAHPLLIPPRQVPCASVSPRERCPDGPRSSVSLDGTGESRVGFPTAGGSSAPRSLFILLSFFLCFVLFLPHLLCCQLFLSPGANL